MDYEVRGQSQFEGAFIATSERIIMNVDMNGQFYYRSIGYDEANDIQYDGKTITFDFNIGKIPMHDFKSKMYKVLLILLKKNYNQSNLEFQNQLN